MAGLARREWQRLSPDDLDGSWSQVSATFMRGVVAAQLASARLAEDYVAACLAAQDVVVDADGQVVPETFAGWAPDGRDLAPLLDQPLIGAKTDIGAGRTPHAALASAWESMLSIVQTVTSDSGRQAVGVGIAARPGAGWTRMVATPCCSRCAILAGKFFRYSTGFLRHPRCSCTHIPASEDSFGDVRTDPMDLVRGGHVRGLAQADQRALADGADLNRVVNVHPRRAGMSTSDAIKGRTREGRVTPEGIYRQAEDRAEALRLLRLHGYLL